MTQQTYTLVGGPCDGQVKTVTAETPPREIAAIPETRTKIRAEAGFPMKQEDLNIERYTRREIGFEGKLIFIWYAHHTMTDVDAMVLMAEGHSKNCFRAERWKAIAELLYPFAVSYSTHPKRNVNDRLRFVLDTYQKAQEEESDHG